jgi:hypothetical protein
VRLIAGVYIGTTPAVDDTELIGTAPALDDSESREQEDRVQALVTTRQPRHSYHVILLNQATSQYLSRHEG